MHLGLPSQLPGTTALCFATSPTVKVREARDSTGSIKAWCEAHGVVRQASKPQVAKVAGFNVPSTASLVRSVPSTASIVTDVTSKKADGTIRKAIPQKTAPTNNGMSDVTAIDVVKATEVSLAPCEPKCAEAAGAEAAGVQGSVGKLTFSYGEGKLAMAYAKASGPAVEATVDSADDVAQEATPINALAVEIEACRACSLEARPTEGSTGSTGKLQFFYGRGKMTMAYLKVLEKGNRVSVDGRAGQIAYANPDGTYDVIFDDGFRENYVSCSLMKVESECGSP